MSAGDLGDCDAHIVEAASGGCGGGCAVRDLRPQGRIGIEEVRRAAGDDRVEDALGLKGVLGLLVAHAERLATFGEHLREAQGIRPELRQAGIELRLDAEAEACDRRLYRLEGAHAVPVCGLIIGARTEPVGARNEDVGDLPCLSLRQGLAIQDRAVGAEPVHHIA